MDQKFHYTLLSFVLKWQSSLPACGVTLWLFACLRRRRKHAQRDTYLHPFDTRLLICLLFWNYFHFEFINFSLLSKSFHLSTSLSAKLIILYNIIKYYWFRYVYVPVLWAYRYSDGQQYILWLNRGNYSHFHNVIIEMPRQKNNPIISKLTQVCNLLSTNTR